MFLPSTEFSYLRQFRDMFTIILRHVAAIVDCIETIACVWRFHMVQFAFLLVVIFGGMAVLTPIVGLTVYCILRPWLAAYTARQNALAAAGAYEPGDRR